MKPFKLSELTAGGRIDRHRHEAPYATLLLEGSYEEAGDAGRHQAVAGEVLLHAPFSCHLDRVSYTRTRVLDLPLPFNCARHVPRAIASDPDRVVRLAERDPAEAIDCLFEQMCPLDDSAQAPADRLSAALRKPGGEAIGDWARAQGLSREYLSRQFRTVYGVTAAAYRLESLARRAWLAIIGTDDSLAAIAGDTGFADQAHMSRAVLGLTHRTPGQWRAWSRQGKALAA